MPWTQCLCPPTPKINCLSSDTHCIWRCGFGQANRFRWGHGDLKLNAQKTKIMASSPITSGQIDSEKMETVADSIFLGSQITTDGDWSHEIKRHLLFVRRAMTNLKSILKTRDITLLTKVCLVKAMIFPVVIYGCESWIIKKADWVLKNWCFQIVVLEKTWESLGQQGDQIS